MTMVPVTTGARLLVIHPKTLHHWLTAAKFPLAAHPSDARLKGVAEEHLLELASLHGRPLPAEVRARSRVTALIEYGAQGQYVAVCPKLGVLSLIPDSPQWCDWSASLTSFRFAGPAGRFSACRASDKGQYTPCWAARRFFHGHDFWHYLGVTDRLTLACLEQAAAALQARVDAL
jgi:hypothetical protein